MAELASANIQQKGTAEVIAGTTQANIIHTLTLGTTMRWYFIRNSTAAKRSRLITQTLEMEAYMTRSVRIKRTLSSQDSQRLQIMQEGITKTPDKKLDTASDRINQLAEWWRLGDLMMTNAMSLLPKKIRSSITPEVIPNHKSLPFSRTFLAEELRLWDLNLCPVQKNGTDPLKSWCQRVHSFGCFVQKDLQWGNVLVRPMKINKSIKSIKLSPNSDWNLEPLNLRKRPH